jgi:hypothetical protein
MKIKTTSQILQLISTLPNKDALLYFTYQILKRNTNKDVYLSSQVLKKTFGDRAYKTLINQLVELGIVEVLTNYREKEYPYNTYKILLPHSKKDLIDHEITDTKLIKRVEYIIENKFDMLPPYIKQVLFNLESLVLTDELRSELKKDGIHLEDEIFFTNNNVFKPRISKSKSGRVHHTLTNLNKKYRKKLSSTHGNLVEIDAKNAQLIFLSQLCLHDSIFNEDVFGGVFYEKLSMKMGVDISIKSVRDDFKCKFFKTILCNENKAVIANNKFTNAFCSLYPIMFNYLITLNQDSTKATMLQELEAEFFITNILKDIIELKLFAIPVHDAMIILEKDIEAVMTIINDHSTAFFNRQITTSIEHYTFCSTPCNSALLIRKEEETTRRREENNNKCICSANVKGVEQNKNQIKSQETIEKITKAIITLNEEGAKVTTRNIQARAGVTVASVNKHYKAILSDLENDNSDSITNITEKNTIELEASNEAETTINQYDSNGILNVFTSIAEKHCFPKDIIEIFENHINNNGFDSVDEMIEEVNEHPFLRHLLDQRKNA